MIQLSHPYCLQRNAVMLNKAVHVTPKLRLHGSGSATTDALSCKAVVGLFSCESGKAELLLCCWYLPYT